MYIRRKVYSISALQNELIEKAFSEGYKKGKEDSEKEDNERVTTDITKTKSYRGIGRSGFGGIYGIVGRAAGVRHATKLSKEGKVTDKEMVKKAGRRAALVGGALGTLVGAGKMYKNGDDLIDSSSDRVARILGEDYPFYDAKTRKAAKVAAALTAGGISALAARAGARKNVKERLLKKHLKDNDIKTDKKKSEE